MVASTTLRDARDLLQVHEWGDCTTISLASETYSFMDDALLLSTLQRILLETQCHHLVFDLTEFEGASSSVLALFVWPVRSGVKVTLCNPSPHICDILKRTRLDNVVKVVRPTRRGLN
ncbi:MAG: STAS domain-containing protein [Planctomycetota bacterium]|jgi:anti-anti-sigma regulatory factor